MSGSGSRTPRPWPESGDSYVLRRGVAGASSTGGVHSGERLAQRSGKGIEGFFQVNPLIGAISSISGETSTAVTVARDVGVGRTIEARLVTGIQAIAGEPGYCGLAGPAGTL
jgi:hypothetical protein